MIGSTHSPLYLSMDPASLLHRFCLHHSAFSIVNIPRTQDKFDQITDRYFYDTFFVLFNLFAHI